MRLGQPVEQFILIDESVKVGVLQSLLPGILFNLGLFRAATIKMKLYFRFVLSGSKSSDYYLLNLDVNDSKFSPEGTYRAFADAITVDGV